MYMQRKWFGALTLPYIFSTRALCLAASTLGVQSCSTRCRRRLCRRSFLRRYCLQASWMISAASSLRHWRLPCCKGRGNDTQREIQHSYHRYVHGADLQCFSLCFCSQPMPSPSNIPPPSQLDHQCRLGLTSIETHPLLLPRHDVTRHTLLMGTTIKEQSMKYQYV